LRESIAKGHKSLPKGTADCYVPSTLLGRI
jgi:hypothetical protein